MPSTMKWAWRGRGKKHEKRRQKENYEGKEAERINLRKKEWREEISGELRMREEG